MSDIWREEPDIEGCPLTETHDKCEESHYYLERCLLEYHRPRPFRWSLNAFLQSLRSVTFYLQNEMADVPGFSGFYEGERATMRDDGLLKSIADQRTIVVHENTLVIESTVEAGLFRGRELKMAVRSDQLGAGESSAQILRRVVPIVVGHWVTEDHAAIDEQVGIRRTWVVKEIGDGDVIAHCDAAWSRTEAVTSRAHRLVGRSSAVPPEGGHLGTGYNVLLESDLDPGLPKQWGWEDEEWAFDVRSGRSFRRTA